MAHEVTWDAAFEASPAGADSWEFGASKIREQRKAKEERLGLAHEMSASFLSSHGLHRWPVSSYTVGAQSLNAGQEYIHCIPVGDITLTLPLISTCQFANGRAHGFFIYVTKASPNAFAVTLATSGAEVLQINNAGTWTLGGAGQACFVYPYDTTHWCVNQYSTRRGSIIMWGGAVSAIPYGWYLSDGTNGTRNLSGQFIAGYYASDSTEPSFGTIGNTGGFETHKLVIAEMPAHSHNYYWVTTGGQGSTSYGPSDDFGILTTGDTGGDSPHENLPPYYVLAFLSKD
jgi:hypothetical protein